MLRKAYLRKCISILARVYKIIVNKLRITVIT